MRPDQLHLHFLRRLLHIIGQRGFGGNDADDLILHLALLRDLRVRLGPLDFAGVLGAGLDRDLALADRFGNLLGRFDLADQRRFHEDVLLAGFGSDMFAELILKRFADRAANDVRAAVFRALNSAHRKRGPQDDLVDDVAGIPDEHEHLRRFLFIDGPFDRALNGKPEAVPGQKADFKFGLVTLHADDVDAVDVGIQVICTGPQRSRLDAAFAGFDEDPVGLLWFAAIPKGDDANFAGLDLHCRPFLDHIRKRVDPVCARPQRFLNDPAKVRVLTDEKLTRRRCVTKLPNHDADFAFPDLHQRDVLPRPVDRVVEIPAFA